METNKTLMLRVGIFITIGLILLVWFSLKTEAPTKIKGGYQLFTRFEQVKGIEIGSMVTMSGVDIGRVEKIFFDSEANMVRVDLSVRGDVKIRKDSIAGIYMKSLLGQNLINIHPGDKEGGFLNPGDEIKSKPTIDMDRIIEIVSDFGKNANELMTNLNENQKGLIDRISSVIDENRDNIKQTTASFAEVGPKLNTVVSDLQEIIAGVKNGEGTIGKLVKDDQIYEKFSSFSTDLADISKKVNSGEGTLGKLLVDDSLHKSASESLDIVRDAAKEIKSFLSNNQKGISEVVDSLKESVPNIKKASEQLYEITDKVNSGKGTLGKLINDPTLYNEAKDAINQIKQTFQENEEQAVMRTFLGIVFGSMM